MLQKICRTVYPDHAKSFVIVEWTEPKEPEEIISTGVVNGINLAEHRISIPKRILDEMKNNAVR